VDLREAWEVRSPDGYDAVVLGSALYMGREYQPVKRDESARRERQ
jgi:hypothetical protein